MPAGAAMAAVKPRVNGRGWSERFRRLLRYRLIVPLKRSQHPPKYTAYGIGIGLVWALTPTVGIQMLMVLITWLIARYVFRWDFNLIVAAAWTWTTNYLNALPVYYVFYVTGQVMLGRWDNPAGYHAFVDVSQSFFHPPAELSPWELTVYYATTIFTGWGVPMLVGCIPWSIAGGFLGYWWGLRFVCRFRALREDRRRAARERNGARRERLDRARGTL